MSDADAGPKQDQDPPLILRALDALHLRERVEEALEEANEAGEQPDDEGDAGEADGAEDKAGDKADEEKVPPTLVEWGARVVSILLLVALVGYATRMGLQPTRAPVFEHEVQSSEIEQRGESWVVPVEITNTGNESVAELNITAELVDANDEVVDEADITFPLFGPEESEMVEFWFDEDPSEYKFRLNVGSYYKP